MELIDHPFLIEKYGQWVLRMYGPLLDTLLNWEYLLLRVVREDPTYRNDRLNRDIVILREYLYTDPYESGCDMQSLCLDIVVIADESARFDIG